MIKIVSLSNKKYSSQQDKPITPEKNIYHKLIHLNKKLSALHARANFLQKKTFPSNQMSTSELTSSEAHDISSNGSNKHITLNASLTEAQKVNLEKEKPSSTADTSSTGAIQKKEVFNTPADQENNSSTGPSLKTTYSVEVDSPNISPSSSGSTSFFEKIKPSKADPKYLFSFAMSCCWLSMIFSIIKLLIILYFNRGSILVMVKHLPITVNLILLVINVAILFILNKKNKWARTAFAILSVASFFPFQDYFTLLKAPLITIAFLIEIILRVYGVWLLYTPKVSNYF